MNAFLLIIPIFIVLLLGPLLVPPRASQPRFVVATQAPQASAAAWRQQQREELYRRAMREESVGAARE